MLKIKAIMAALLLVATVNASALCVYNNTNKPVFFYSDQDVVTNQAKKVPAGTRHCTLPGEAGFGYVIMDSKEDDATIICASLWTNVLVQTVDVVKKDDLYSTCELS